MVLASDVQNVTKDILLALGVDRTTRDAVKAKFTRVPSLSHKPHLLQWLTRLGFVHVSTLHRSKYRQAL